MIPLLTCIPFVNAGTAIVEDSQLDDWIRTIIKPEFTLLVKKHKKTILFAVFKAKDSSIAICYKNTDYASQQSHSRTDIYSVEGHSLLDNSRPFKEITREWKRPIENGFASGTVRDGFLYPLLPYNGFVTVKFEFKDDNDSTKNVQITEKIVL